MPLRATGILTPRGSNGTQARTDFTQPQPRDRRAGTQRDMVAVRNGFVKLGAGYGG
jgi:hypothetical protein